MLQYSDREYHSSSVGDPSALLPSPLTGHDCCGCKIYNISVIKILTRLLSDRMAMKPSSFQVSSPPGGIKHVSYITMVTDACTDEWCLTTNWK